MLLPLPTPHIIAVPFHQTEQDRRRLHQKLRSLKVKIDKTGEKRGRNNNKKYYLCSQERVGSQFVAICDRL